MTLKSVRALVKWKDGTVRRLNEIRKEDDPLVRDQVSMLEEIYPQLWKLYLFAEPRLRSLGKRIQDVFCEVLEEETGLNATCDPAFRHYLREGCMDYRLGVLLDRELDQHAAVKKLGVDKRKKVTILSHEQIPPDPYSDEHADEGTQVLASKVDEPRLRKRLRQMVNNAISGAAKI
jgi:hypothetical protein